MSHGNSCHIQILPQSDNDGIKLIRYMDHIFKFTIKMNDVSYKLLREHGEHKIQWEFEQAILHALHKATTDLNEIEEIMVHTESLTVKFNLHPWKLSHKICFEGVDNLIYCCGKYQFLVSFLERNKVAKEIPAAEYQQRMTNFNEIRSIEADENSYNASSIRDAIFKEDEVLKRYENYNSGEDMQQNKADDMELRSPHKKLKTSHGIFYRIFKFIWRF
nr:uncharacterized protein LOC107447608 isoform X1 [Parasteatoda tepidariorum]